MNESKWLCTSIIKPSGEGDTMIAFPTDMTHTPLDERKMMEDQDV